MCSLKPKDLSTPNKILAYITSDEGLDVNNYLAKEIWNMCCKVCATPGDANYACSQDVELRNFRLCMILQT